MQLMVDPIIQYVLVLPSESDPPDFSIFQGCSRSLLQRVGWFKHVLCHFPPTIDEAFRPSLQTLQLRLAGIAHYRAFPLHIDQLRHVPVSPATPFWVMIADEEVEHATDAWANSQDLPVLVVKPPKSIGEQPSVRFADIQDHLWSVLEALETRFGLANHWTSKVRSKYPKRQHFDIDFGVAGHTLTLPNELLLVSVGGQFDGEKKAICGADELHIQRILQTADEAAVFRTVVPTGPIFEVSPCMPTVMVTCPATYKHVRGIRREKGQQVTPAFQMLRVLQKQKTYSIHFDDGEDGDELLQNAGSQFLLDERTRESIAHTEAVSLRAASYLTPTLRLPPAVNHVRPEIIRLIDCINSDSPSPKKIRKLVDKLGEAFDRAIDSRFLARLDQRHAAVKLVADIPLEWLPLRGLPLALRHVVSRISVTPGNSSYIQILPRDQIELPAEAFKETLVVRSFRPDDPLRKDLENAIRFFCKSDGSALPVRFVDVTNREELIAAINSCRGAILIYDGHGIHSEKDDIGYLQLANENVNPWSLRDEIHCPPILFACGCETHAVNGSHVTPANGFLQCGASAVIATSMPINSRAAALLTARLLFNVHSFLPKLVSELGVSVRWDFVFSIIQQITFVSDLVTMLKNELDGDVSWLDSLQADTTTALLNRDYEWFENLLQMVADKHEMDVGEIDQLRRNKLPFSECLKYSNFGNPDLIVIHPGTATIAKRLSLTTNDFK